MKRIIILIILLSVATIGSVNRNYLSIQLRFLAGFKEEVDPSPKVITAFNLTPFFSGSIISDLKPEQQVESLKNVFHLKHVKVLSEADLTWEEGENQPVFHIVRINGNEFQVLITPEPRERDVLFRVKVHENRKTGSKNLLDTQVVLPFPQVAVLGFYDSQKNPFFLAFHIDGGVMKPGQKPNHPSEMRPLESSRQIQIEKAPPVIRKKSPIYPPVALRAKIQGVVWLTATIDKFGKVIEARVDSGHPLLNEAASMAVAEWVYKPYLVSGKAIPVSFPVKVEFIIHPGSTPGEKKDTTADGFPPVPHIDGTKAPKIIRKVEAVYPPVALKARIQGEVRLTVAIDIYGKVLKVKTDSGHPLLQDAAITAVQQWIYEPYIQDGHPASVSFPVSVSFQINSKPSQTDNRFDMSETKYRRVSVKQVKLIKKVSPTYPKEALEKKIEGIVILEAVTDIYGRVSSVKVIEGVEELNQAALDAVKQWIYSPFIVDGKPVPVQFTVTVHFSLH